MCRPTSRCIGATAPRLSATGACANHGRARVRAHDREHRGLRWRTMGYRCVTKPTMHRATCREGRFRVVVRLVRSRRLRSSAKPSTRRRRRQAARLTVSSAQSGPRASPVMTPFTVEPTTIVTIIERASGENHADRPSSTPSKAPTSTPIIGLLTEMVPLTGPIYTRSSRSCTGCPRPACIRSGWVLRSKRRKSTGDPAPADLDRARWIPAQQPSCRPARQPARGRQRDEQRRCLQRSSPSGAGRGSTHTRETRTCG